MLCCFSFGVCLCTQALKKLFAEDEYEHIVKKAFQFKADVDSCIEISTWSADQLHLTGEMSKLRVSCSYKAMQKHHNFNYYRFLLQRLIFGEDMTMRQ